MECHCGIDKCDGDDVARRDGFEAFRRMALEALSKGAGYLETSDAICALQPPQQQHGVHPEYLRALGDVEREVHGTPMDEHQIMPIIARLRGKP